MANLYIVSAPSGGGKTSLVAALLEAEEGIEASLSCTTRPPRPGEVDGQDYRFVDRTRFDAMAARGEFLEVAEVFGYAYGTPGEEVRRRLAAGVDVVLRIDWRGARQVRRHIEDVVSVFLLPPSRAVLEQRLHGRGQDDAAVIARRLSEAREEIERWSEYDFLVVNDDFQRALADLRAIVRCRRLRREPQGERLEAVLAEFG